MKPRKQNASGLIKRLFLAGVLAFAGLSTLSFSGCVSNHYKASKQYWEEVREGKRENPNHYEVSKRYWEKVRQQKKSNQNNHRHYPSVNETLQENVGTYMILQGLESLRK